MLEELPQKKFGIGSRYHYYFNSLSLLEKFPISATSIIKKDNILSRNANWPVEAVLQTALLTPRNCKNQKNENTIMTSHRL